MARNNENRVRNKTVSFWMTPSEHTQLLARIKISGMAKGEYFIQSLLHQEINIIVGRYKSDRLALELKRMRETLETLTANDEIANIMFECQSLLEQLQTIISDNQDVSARDFATKKMP